MLLPNSLSGLGDDLLFLASTLRKNDLFSLFAKEILFTYIAYALAFPFVGGWFLFSYAIVYYFSEVISTTILLGLCVGIFLGSETLLIVCIQVRTSICKKLEKLLGTKVDDDISLKKLANIIQKNQQAMKKEN